MTTSSPSSRLRIRLCLLTRFTCNGFCLESMSTIVVEFVTCTLQEYVLPQEYVQTMRESMLKRCPVSSYEDVQGVFKEIGELPETVFTEFDHVPLASASLAQVHAATTHDGKKVAVKVRHDHLLDTSVIDIATVDLVVNALNYIFPTFDYSCMYIKSTRCVDDHQLLRTNPMVVWTSL
ncbi:putative ABC1 protein [Hordeum vulgare]|nr:putative ABC1 protein [Hordeum vulgare]